MEGYQEELKKRGSGLREHGMECRPRWPRQAVVTRQVYAPEPGVLFVDADFNHPDHPLHAEICEHGRHLTRCKECGGHAGDRASVNMEGSAENAGTETDHGDIDVEFGDLAWMDGN